LHPVVAGQLLPRDLSHAVGEQTTSEACSNKQTLVSKKYGLIKTCLEKYETNN
jgi:hypothetical protein